MAPDNHDQENPAQNIMDDAIARDEKTLGLEFINTEILSSVIKDVNTSNCNNKRKRNLINGSQNDSDKAATFPISSIQIGSWKREAQHDEELVAKCYFKKKKMAWEVLIGKLKAKFEFFVYCIDAINSIFLPNKDILYIKLKKPPNFFIEENPQPKKHTSWQECKDFTDEQVATNTSVHRLEFSRGVLKKHYSKIINSDPDLLKVSTKEIPMDESQLFNNANGTMSEFPSNPRVPQQFSPFQAHANCGIPTQISPARQFPSHQHNQLAIDERGSRAYVDSLYHQQFGNAVNNTDHERLLHDYSPTLSTPVILNNPNNIPQFSPSISPALLLNNTNGPFSAHSQLGGLMNGFSGAPNVDVRRLPPSRQMQQPRHYGNDNRFENQSAMNNTGANQVTGLYMK